MRCLPNFFCRSLSALTCEAKLLLKEPVASGDALCALPRSAPIVRLCLSAFSVVLKRRPGHQGKRTEPPDSESLHDGASQPAGLTHPTLTSCFYFFVISGLHAELLPVGPARANSWSSNPCEAHQRTTCAGPEVLGALHHPTQAAPRSLQQSPVPGPSCSTHKPVRKQPLPPSSGLTAHSCVVSGSYCQTTCQALDLHLLILNHISYASCQPWDGT